MLIWLDMKIQLLVLIWWTSDSRSLQLPCVTFIGIATQEASRHVPGFCGWLSNGLATTGNHLLPATIRKLTSWETHSRDQEVQVRSKLQKKKRRTESHKGQQIHPWVYSSFLHLGFSAPVFESQCSLWGEKVCWRTNSSKGFIEQKYLLKIFKVAGEKEKARKGGSGSALSKENVWTEWGKNVGENWADLRINLFLIPFTKN